MVLKGNDVTNRVRVPPPTDNTKCHNFLALIRKSNHSIICIHIKLLHFM